MPNSMDDKAFAAAPDMADYVHATFAMEDPLLADIRVRARDAGLPAIHVSPYDGRHLEVIARAAAARHMVEIGTLAGYSGVCLARALPEGGVLHTFEFEPRHAAVARESFRKAGVDSRVRIHVGPALDNLPKVEDEGPFDLVFIDADKGHYPQYLAWAGRHLRRGGVVLVDNAFAWGLVNLPDDHANVRAGGNAAARQAIMAVNAELGKHPAWRGTMLPTGEGLAMAVKVA